LVQLDSFAVTERERRMDGKPAGTIKSLENDIAIGNL
jgi:hypothetical protein